MQLAQVKLVTSKHQFLCYSIDRSLIGWLANFKVYFESILRITTVVAVCYFNLDHHAVSCLF